MIAAVLAAVLVAAPSQKIYVNDAKFALDHLERDCKHLLKAKKVAWGKVSKQILKDVRKVKDAEGHWVLLARLVARLRDGHAAVLTTAKTQKLAWSGPKLERSPGLSLCFGPKRKKLYVKRVWGPAEKAGVKAGWEVVKVDGAPAAKWLKRRRAELADLFCLATDHHADYFTCHWGLGGPSGSRLSLDLRNPDTKKTKKATLGRTSKGLAPSGPVVFPAGLKAVGRNTYAKLPSGFGYMHLRDVPGDLPDQIDKALAALGDVPGLILDFRANGGGGADHAAAFGRFVPAGKTINFSGKASYASAGARQYAGPIVCIVDAGVRSAGETMSGTFKEDGRAYMIGPSPTAGMSGAKKTLELPSGLFKLYYVVRSHKGRFNGGKGVEGLGVAPHETVGYDPAELRKGVDTQIRRAEELLRSGFPKNTVPYKPGRYGFKAKKQ
ncbi:MAG: S41 family peptidase [Planctomycetota bacterium]|nr:S41 family peptidase [Planctomycetota bacterium]